ncbi:MAG: hypothetical protein IPJ18_18585 [Betaproteobacteria bacterium]|nr:hypothetical protein [Betaproteobacteria bacterium]
MITIPYGKFGGKGWTNGSREPQETLTGGKTVTMTLIGSLKTMTLATGIGMKPSKYWRLPEVLGRHNGSR